MNEFDKITPQTYIDMNKEFVEEGTMLRIVVPTQEQINSWKNKTEDIHKINPKPVDMVAQMWEKLGVYTLEQREQYRKDHGGL